MEKLGFPISKSFDQFKSLYGLTSGTVKPLSSLSTRPFADSVSSASFANLKLIAEDLFFLCMGLMKTCLSREYWFCLSSPSVESHLIISIGENYYLALPKGPLVKDHVLIIPVEHMPNTFSLSSESKVELLRFQNSLERYYKNQEKEVIFFEWASIRGTHANLQLWLEKVFNLAAQKLGFKFVAKKFDSISDGRKFLKTQINGNSSLFYAVVPGGTILPHHVEEKERFPAQFGREVLAGLLNMADNADWRNCKHSKEEEMKIVEDFKSRFQEYDPNC